MFDAKIERCCAAEQTADDAGLRLNPSAILCDYRHDVVTFQRACELEQEPQPILNNATQAVIFRKDYQIITLLLTPFQLQFLQQLVVFGSVEQALTQVSQKANMDTEKVLASWRREPTRAQWLESELLCKPIIR